LFEFRIGVAPEICQILGEPPEGQRCFLAGQTFGQIFEGPKGDANLFLDADQPILPFGFEIGKIVKYAGLNSDQLDLILGKNLARLLRIERKPSAPKTMDVRWPTRWRDSPVSTTFSLILYAGQRGRSGAWSLGSGKQSYNPFFGNPILIVFAPKIPERKGDSVASVAFCWRSAL